MLQVSRIVKPYDTRQKEKKKSIVACEQLRPVNKNKKKQPRPGGEVLLLLPRLNTAIFFLSFWWNRWAEKSHG